MGRQSCRVKLASQLLGMSAIVVAVCFAHIAICWTQPPQRAADWDRREVVLSVPTVLSVIALAPQQVAAKEPLPPPVEKNVAMTAAKLMKGTDELHFDIRPAIKAKRFDDAQQFLGQGSGAYIAPIDNDLFFPLQQILDDNLDAEEDGWVDSMQKARAAFDQMKNQVNREEWKGALASWTVVRDNLGVLFEDINARTSKPYLEVLDDAYFEREEAYKQAKRDAINFRNAMGTLALR
mmetsp:Transcript_53790/g.125758  ORF Transcript_53790/g.125758 Transcript_53790/m.125758 type:complete len:236 (+) Transcript_53790:104-811(+)